MAGRTVQQSPADRYPALQKRYGILEQYEALHFTLLHEMLTQNCGRMFDVDQFIVATLHRSVNLVDGIIKLTENWNAVSALPLMRLQIENLYRLYYVAQQKDDRHAVLEAWRTGTEWRKIKDSSGHILTDRHLCEFAAKQYPWLPDLYKKTCKQVHHSFLHFGHVMSGYDAKEDVAKMTFTIGSEFWAESLIDQFLYDVGNVTDGLLLIVRGWIKCKGSISPDSIKKTAQKPKPK